MFIRRVQALCLVIGPTLFALSPLFWVDGHYGIVGGMLIAVAMVPWGFGLLGEYDRLHPHLPVVSGLWMLLVLIGMFGSIAFGLQCFFEGVLRTTDGASPATFTGYPAAGALVLLLAGPMLPAARVARIDTLAVIADLLMLGTFCVIAWRAWHADRAPVISPS
ncbi:hypothetical protein WDU99_05015 [Microbacterium sp. Mu-80]|uniref:Uncharacterized protein n=1 Tax=Microbacterium bandirmense TaxID=3122050 RepID=A0ABU8LBH2_9MICO